MQTQVPRWGWQCVTKRVRTRSHSLAGVFTSLGRSTGEEACGSDFFPALTKTIPGVLRARRRCYVHVIAVGVSEQDAFGLFTLRHCVQW